MHSSQQLVDFLDHCRSNAPNEQRWGELAERIGISPSTLTGWTPEERLFIWDAVQCALLSSDTANPPLRHMAVGYAACLGRQLSILQHPRFEGPEQQETTWPEVFERIAELLKTDRS